MVRRILGEGARTPAGNEKRVGIKNAKRRKISESQRLGGHRRRRMRMARRRPDGGVFGMLEQDRQLFGVSNLFFVLLFSLLFVLPCTLFISVQVKTEIAVLRFPREEGLPPAAALRGYVLRTAGKGLFSLMYVFIMVIASASMGVFAAVPFFALCIVGFVLSFALKTIVYTRIK